MDNGGKVLGLLVPDPVDGARKFCVQRVNIGHNRASCSAGLWMSGGCPHCFHSLPLMLSTTPFSLSSSLISWLIFLWAWMTVVWSFFLKA